MVITALEHRKPLFLPVTTEVYQWYMGANKHWEIRKYGNWNEKTIASGRDIWVSKGYSGPRFLAATGDNHVGSLDHILDKVPYSEIIPLVGMTKQEARSYVLSILKSHPKEKHIAFEVDMYCV